MTAKPTQEDIVLALLCERGELGAHTFELRERYIANPSERIRRLRKRGHVIRESERERLNGRAFGVRYRLVHHADLSTPTPTEE